MELATFTAPDRFIFGVGSVATLGEEAGRFGTRALLVTGRKALAKAGITDRLEAILRDAGLEVALFDEVEPEPDVTTADRCRDAIRSAGAEVVVGLGGGSAMDVAKVAAGLAGETAETRAFHHGEPPTRPGKPMIAVPTTSGTGSEMTNNGVLTDRSASYKASIRHRSFVPDVALVDPELTVPCPPFVTAASGMDAFVQAVESYLSVNATPLTEAISLRAVDELAAALPDVVKRGEDVGLRTQAAWGSAMAGLALTNARVGVVHGMAHPIGARYEIPHGLVCGVLLPAALDFNRDAAHEKYLVLEDRLGHDPSEWSLEVLGECGLPTTLAAYGLSREAFEAIAEESLPSGSTKANPRPVTKEDVVALLETVV